MTEAKYTISYINETPGIVIRGETPDEVEEYIKGILPIFKKFSEAVDKGKQARMKQQAEQAQPGTPEGEAPICTVHGTTKVWKTGVSKTTNKPYAFWSCPTLNADGSYCRSK